MRVYVKETENFDEKYNGTPKQLQIGFPDGKTIVYVKETENFDEKYNGTPKQLQIAELDIKTNIQIIKDKQNPVYETIYDKAAYNIQIGIENDKRIIQIIKDKQNPVYETIYDKAAYNIQIENIKSPKIDGNNGNANKSKSGVAIMANIKQDGEQVTGFEVKRSVNNQSNEKNIQRDSILATPKMSKNKSVNHVQFAYIQTKLSKEDQWDFKRCGGEHTKNDNREKEGRAYAVGVMVKPGGPTTGFLAKEYPKHSDTPKFPKEVKYGEFKEIPDVNDKVLGIQTVGYATPQGTYKIACYIDKSAMDKKIEDLTEPPNKWELFFTAEDNGKWNNGKDEGGEPYLTNQGIANGGECMFLYGRIDHVTYPTKVKFAGAVEIEPGE